MRGRRARRYEVFLSYGHAADATLAPVLQSQLQRYAKPWYRVRSMRVFRDDTDLAAEPDLWASIERALAASSWFVLLASPAAAASPWVDREVRWWLENRSADRLLLVLTEGEPDEVLPPALDAAGLPEPGWVDARALGHDGAVDPDGTRLRDAVVDVAATVRGIPKERLVSEHRREHRRTLRWAGGAIAGLSVLLVAAVVATVVAVAQRDQAVDQRRLATARLLLPQAEADRRTDPRTALLLNEAARHLHPDAQTDASLLQTLLTNRYEAMLSGEGREGAAETVAFSPDRRTAAVGNFDGSVVLWDVADPGAPHRLGAPLTGFDYAVQSVAFSPDGHTLAAGSDDQSILLWDVTDPGRARRLGTPPPVSKDMVWSIAFSPDGRTMATGGFGGQIILWDVTDPARAHPRGAAFTSPTGAPGALALSPDGRTLATGGNSTVSGSTSAVVLWDVTDPATPRLRGAPLPGRTGSVESVAFSPDGHTLAAGDVDGVVMRWDVTDPARPRPQGAPLDGQAGGVESVAFSHDGSTLAVAAGRAGTVVLWALNDPAGPRRRDDLTGTGQAGGVNSVAFSPDGGTLATAGEDSSTVLWDLRAPTGPSPLGRPVDSPAGGAFREPTALSADGRTLAAGGGDAHVALWDTTDPARPRPLGPPVAATVGTVYSVALSPDRRTLVAGTGGGSDGAVVLWDVSDPARPGPGRTLPGRVGTVETVTFSPDGRTLAVADQADSDAVLWDVGDPFRPVRLPPLHSESAIVPSTVTFSPDGHVLAAGNGEGAVTLWDVRDPIRPGSLGALSIGTTGVETTAFTPDGHVLAAGNGEGAVTLWDVRDPVAPRRIGAPLAGSQGHVTSVAFSPDGYVLAAATADGGVALWDVRDPTTPRALGTPVTGHSESTSGSVAFFPSGRTLLTGIGDDHSVLRWDLTALLALRDDTLGHACGITRGGLTPAQWYQFVPGSDYENAC